jgi:glutathione gamma-glutamylcysteinyltransferase
MSASLLRTRCGDSGFTDATVQQLNVNTTLARGDPAKQRARSDGNLRLESLQVRDSEIWQERVIRVKQVGSSRIYHVCQSSYWKHVSTVHTVNPTVLLFYTPRTYGTGLQRPNTNDPRNLSTYKHRNARFFILRAAPNDHRRPMGPRSAAAAALRLRGPCLSRCCFVSNLPHGRRATCAAATANAASLNRGARPPDTTHARRFQSTSAASQSLRPSDSHPDEHNDTGEQDCLWLSSRHCRTCACHQDSPPPPASSSATPPLSPPRAAATKAPLASTQNGPLSPQPSNLTSEAVADKQQQPDAVRLRSQEPNDANNNNPLASRLMELMSAPAASSVLQPPIPAYSVRRRVLPRDLTRLNSPQGQDYLVHALVGRTAASYVPLTLHFANQSDPAFCGITTLLVVLNAMSIDPHTRWKGGWRYFGDEESLLGRCCLSVEHVQSLGITLDEFYRLASCQGLRVQMKRAISNNNVVAVNGASDAPPLPSSVGSLEEFRRDVISVLTDDAATIRDNTKKKDKAMMVVSFGRSGLQQTGDGHFSPVAAYHSETDQVLVLDVARFKYPPYWVSVKDLHAAMTLRDQATQQSRGWFVLQKPSTIRGRRRAAAPARPHDSSPQLDTNEDDEHAWDADDDDDGDDEGEGEGEDRRPAHLVPPQKEASWCPLHKVKIEYCRNVTNKSGSGSKWSENLGRTKLT